MSGAVEGGPADQAGVRGGDIIVSLAGKKVEDVYDYSYAIEALKIGEEVTIEVIREGNKIPLKITPGSRD
ncbi:MAG: PDZ domain-containing protein [Planctomycetota bacterium]